MANPQLENGYTRMANEYLDARARTRVPGECEQLMKVVERLSWGFRKHEASISLDQFVLRTGMKKASIIRGLHRLEKMRLITISKNANGNVHSYRINKNFEEWIPFTKKLTISKNANGDLQKCKSGFTKKLTPIVYKENLKKTLKKEETLSQRFKKPSIEEIRTYIKSEKLNADPDKFFDHFESNGWRDGGKAPMRDWKAAVRNWSRRNFGQNENTANEPEAVKKLQALGAIK